MKRQRPKKTDGDVAGRVMIHTQDTDTIAAQATPPGRGGISVIRISGPLTQQICQALTDQIPEPRKAEYCNFLDSSHNILDQGIALFFKGPNSFTGEDVLELQGHGGPIIVDLVLQQVLQLGARIARPGEFSERAFLNNKLDLAQAEAIADLINSGSEQAARSALRTLQGEFSTKVQELSEQLIQIRTYTEAAIDFPEEEIDHLADQALVTQLKSLQENLRQTIANASQGVTLQEGLTIVVAGRPNAGKSTLLNRLSGRDAAIVTDIPGTTRDLLREYVNLDGIPVHIIDTAGLRQSNDPVETEGVRRAWEEIKNADHILLLTDSRENPDIEHPLTIWPDFAGHTELLDKISVIQNKIDLTSQEPSITNAGDRLPCPVLKISAKTGQGMDLLKLHLKQNIGMEETPEGLFIARRRHLNALKKALALVNNGLDQLLNEAAGELLAEDLRLAGQQLGEITGQFTSDDLLGSIFSSFCIGK